MNTVRETANPLKTRNVTAVLGPTNTGKTHLAIERMLSHQTGLIGLPLRLLAREVYDKVVARVGADAVALITGEEKIKPESPRYWVCTVEAMPRDLMVDFVAVDEIQLAADAERGHIFTERLYHARGTTETLLLGAATMRETIKELMPAANFVSRPRLSKLTFAGSKKMSRLPRRSAIVAFSAAEVYEIAEHIRRQHGGAAVVLGAQSPRTRNAQVHLYQAGDVDFIVATDAIGMGLNLDVDHVAFAATRKFDGREHRDLSLAELGQIAGRAGRHLNDGTFGVTGDTAAFEPDVVERLEKHEFEPVKVLQWRNGMLDFSSLNALRDALRALPSHPRLTRARMADDVTALETLSADPEVRKVASSPEALRKLWEACQVPDYRKVSPATHAELVGQLFGFVTKGNNRIPEDWFAEQVAMANKGDGDIDTLSQRLAHIRTWTFVSHRSEWLANHEHWQATTRDIEHMLSDAMHEQLTQRFVDKRTSTLMRRLRDDEELKAEFGEDGSIKVENHFVGRLVGFRFMPESTEETPNGKAARHAAAQVLSKELSMRARRVAAARSDAFKLTRNATIEWRGEELGKLEKSDDPLKPTVAVLCDEHLTPADKEKVQTRLNDWLTEATSERLKPLTELAKAEDVTGLARGIAFRLKENFGVLKRDSVANDLKELDQEGRAQLRRFGIRFGAFNIYFPLLLKPAASDMLQTFWRLSAGERLAAIGGGTFESPRAGLTSVLADKLVPEEFYRVAGYHLCGPRAVRLDMLERLADMIRPLTGFRLNAANPVNPPKGSSGDGGFIVVPEMMSILGCSAEELTLVLRSLGFRSERRPAAPKVAAAAKRGLIAADSAPLPETTLLTETEAELAADSLAVDAVATAEAGEVSEPVVLANVTEPIAETVAVVDASLAVELPPDALSSDSARDVAEEFAAATPDVADVVLADVAAVDADVSATVDTTVVAPEPEMVEVWRPRRRHEDMPNRGGERRRNRGRGGEQSATAGAGDRPASRQRSPRGPRPGAEPAAAVAATPNGDAAVAVVGGEAVAASGAPQERPANGGRDTFRNNRPRRDGQPQGGRTDRPREPATATAAGETSAGASSPADRPAGDRPRYDRPRQDGPRTDAARPGGDRRNDRSGPPRGASGRDGGPRRDGDSSSRGPRPSQSHRDERRQTYDPNSPFAKLSALKAALEDQQRNQS